MVFHYLGVGNMLSVATFVLSSTFHLSFDVQTFDAQTFDIDVKLVLDFPCLLWVLDVTIRIKSNELGRDCLCNLGRGQTKLTIT